MQILIVEDDDAIAKPLAAGLEREGFDVTRVSNGEDALEAALPDLVLLDVNLPDTDGFQVARRLTAKSGAPAVVLVSSRDHSDFGPLVTGSGARGFISKGDLSGAAIAELL